MFTTKTAFILYFTVLSKRGHHVHQTNGGFVYDGLNADCCVVSEQQQRNNIRLHILVHQSKSNNYNKFDGIMQTNLSRDKVEIVTRFPTPFQMNGQRARCATGINQLR